MPLFGRGFYLMDLQVKLGHRRNGRPGANNAVQSPVAFAFSVQIRAHTCALTQGMCTRGRSSWPIRRMICKLKILLDLQRAGSPMNRGSWIMRGGWLHSPYHTHASVQNSHGSLRNRKFWSWPLMPNWGDGLIPIAAYGVRLHCPFV